MSLDEKVSAHYAPGALGQAILDALVADGKNIDALTCEDLAPVDAFHIGGWQATERMAEALRLAAGMTVVDLGSGLGGTARQLASTHCCNVTGIDLTAEYCRVASMLATRLGLSGQVRFHEGDALRTPFADGAFDAAYTQHAAMNIPDKAGLYEEAERLLKPGGRFCIYDIAKGPGGDVIYPTPWARDPSASFLATPDEMVGLLQKAGFAIEYARDLTADALTHFRRKKAALEGKAPPSLGFHVMLGPAYKEMAANQLRNFTEDRLVLAEIICQKK